MKTWKHWNFVTILAVFGICVTFFGCDNGNGDSDPVCECQNGTVYYDEECTCGNNNCNCKSEYKPVFETLFGFLASADTSPNNIRIQTQTAYNAIWDTNPQLVLRLKIAVTIKDSLIDVGYVDTDISNSRIEFDSISGRIRVYGEVTDADFKALFEAAIEDCVAFYLQE